MGEGILIVFEGIDGAGKTTQVRLLEAALSGGGEDVLVSKEPTNGKWGQALRESAKDGRLPLDQELDHFIRDRIEHLEMCIQPALKRGQVVILDRYYHSTIAYQGARGAKIDDLIEAMGNIAIPADVAYIMDVPVSVAMERIASRDQVPNQFERQATLAACREIYASLAESEATACRVDATMAIDTIHGDIIQHLIDGVLREKRCARSVCEDEFHCTARIVGACQWTSLRGVLLPKVRPPRSAVSVA